MSKSPSDHFSRQRSESQADRKVLLEEAARLAFRYLAELNERPVFPKPDALAGLASFDEPFPADPQDPLVIHHFSRCSGFPVSQKQVQ